MQRTLYRRHHPVRQLLQQIRIGRLGQGQRYRPAKPFQIVIILPQIVLKGFQQQAAVLDGGQKRMGKNGVPDGLRCLTQLLAETGHIS